MATQGFFQWSSPTDQPYTASRRPVPAQPFVHQTRWANLENCSNCLRQALGCGGQATDDGLKSCQAVADQVVGVLRNDCTLEASVHSSFAPGLAPECEATCSAEFPLQYGSGYQRPYAAHGEPPAP